MGALKLTHHPPPPTEKTTLKNPEASLIKVNLNVQIYLVESWMALVEEESVVTRVVKIILITKTGDVSDSKMYNFMCKEKVYLIKSQCNAFVLGCLDFHRSLFLY